MLFTVVYVFFYGFIIHKCSRLQLNMTLLIGVTIFACLHFSL